MATNWRKSEDKKRMARKGAERNRRYVESADATLRRHYGLRLLKNQLCKRASVMTMWFIA